VLVVLPDLNEEELGEIACEVFSEVIDNLEDLGWYDVRRERGGGEWQREVDSEGEGCVVGVSRSRTCGASLTDTRFFPSISSISSTTFRIKIMELESRSK
jgi:hypothetical protein